MEDTGLEEVVSNPLQPWIQEGVVSHCMYSLLTWVYLAGTETTARLPSFPEPQYEIMIPEFFSIQIGF